MENENNEIKTETTVNKETADEKINLASILNGSFLTSNFFRKQFGFILFLSLLSVIYISNRNRSEKKINKITDLRNEVREIKSESITIAAELMYASKQSEVYNMVEEKNLGLVEATEPPKKLIIVSED